MEVGSHAQTLKTLEVFEMKLLAMFVMTLLTDDSNKFCTFFIPFHFYNSASVTF